MTGQEAADRGYIEHLLSDSLGIYLPQEFAESFDLKEWGIDDPEVEEILLEGPDHELYWEVWDEVIQDAHFTKDGEEWGLYQDGDLFAFRTDVEIEWM